MANKIVILQFIHHPCPPISMSFIGHGAKPGSLCCLSCQFVKLHYGSGFLVTTYVPSLHILRTWHHTRVARLPQEGRGTGSLSDPRPRRKPGTQYSTVQYSTVQYSTVQYSTVQYSTVQYSTVKYSTMQYCAEQHYTVQ